MWKSTSSSLTPCKNTAKRVQPEAWPTICISDGAKAMNKFIKQMEPQQNIDQQISTPPRKILLFDWTWFNFIKCNSMRSESTKVNECSFKIIWHDLHLLQKRMRIHTIYRKNPSTRSTSKSANPKKVSPKLLQKYTKNISMRYHLLLMAVIVPVRRCLKNVSGKRPRR